MRDLLKSNQKNSFMDAYRKLLPGMKGSLSCSREKLKV